MASKSVVFYAEAMKYRISRSPRWVLLALLAVFVPISGIHAEQCPTTLAGTWEGTLQAGAVSLRVVFNMVAVEVRWTGTMDSPDQGVRGIPISRIACDAGSIILEIALIGGVYRGTIDADGTTIEGFWKQSGITLPLQLKKTGQPEGGTAGRSPSLQPFAAASGEGKETPGASDRNFFSTEVRFTSPSAGIVLAGTMTMPEGDGPFPAVVLITGSGPQDRDETILGHKPFLVIAEHLARHGIASLRCDDRGIGASEGDFQTATTCDFADDAEAALKYLASQTHVDSRRIGLVGHSEGGIIAAMVAARQPTARFAILLASPGIRGDRLLLLQNAALGRASGLSAESIEHANTINRRLYDLAMSAVSDEAARTEIIAEIMAGMTGGAILPASDEAALRQQASIMADQLLAPWMRVFLALDPADYLRQLDIPVLALNGEKDVQVPAEENLAAIGAALEQSHSPSWKLVRLPGLNHLFQHAETGLPSEYGLLQESFAVEALQQMTDWILALPSAP
ncbi:MAG: alpha/beta fold hydrolase [Spirochaetales bacterium]|nr:alpha/beta fold hydrolase [Spirochaetales bacterium]